MLTTIDSHIIGIESGKTNIQNAESVIKKLSETAKAGVFIQLVQSKAICSNNQILAAAKHAITATEQGTAFSQRLEIELLLRVTATRQIGKAVETAGIKEGEQEITIIALSKDKKALEDAIAETKKELNFKPAKTKPDTTYLKKIFNITDNELLALSDKKETALELAIIERIALNALNQ